MVGDVSAYICEACHRTYPIRLGIPDFRVFPDPYISVEDEMEKARRLIEFGRGVSLEETVRFYWRMTAEVPAVQAERYVGYVTRAVGRGRELLDSAGYGLSRGRRGSCLDLGCGTGGLMLAAAERCEHVTGVDIALRWLVIARKRLEENGVQARLVCACAEALPFSAGSFDAVFGLDLLEHASGRRDILGEARRVLRPGGTYVFVTPNRFSLGPEPCVRVWGVGLLPRRLAARYVQLAAGVPYRHIALPSCRELGRLLRQSGLRDGRVRAARILEIDRQTLSRAGRVVAAMYNRLCALPVVRSMLRLCGPLLRVSGRTPA